MSTTVVPRSFSSRTMLPRRRASLDVHLGGRLVEERDVGLADERERERQPAPLAAGQVAVGRPAHALEIEPLEQAFGSSGSS